MNHSTLTNKLAVLALFGGLALTATSAQAARAVSSYNPAGAYTGDPAYAQSRAQALPAPARRVIERNVAPQAPSHNLPYPDRPYGDPDRW
jgi:hypothetical protein